MTTDLKHVFNGYRADFQRTRDWVIINWHHPDINENNHQITYIVNEFTGELHISGDVGEAIFHWYTPNTWQELADYSYDLDRFFSKIKTSSEQDTYDHDTALRELTELIPSDHFEADALSDKYSYPVFINRCMGLWNQHHRGEFPLHSVDDFELLNYLQVHDIDLYEVGHVGSDRMRLWALGLQIISETQSARDQLAERTRHKFFLRPVRANAKNYVLTWRDGTDEVVQATFQLQDDETIGDLIEIWLSFCHDCNFNPNCLIKVDYEA